MEFGGASSLVLLLAVALWLAYVIPSLVRRRNYLATERNAVRLQQTLRALAETAESSDELRVETSGRSVAEQRRRVKQAQRAAEQAEREREAAAARNLPAVPMVRSDDDRRRALAATRRGRLATTLVALVGVAGAGVGAWLGATTGMWWALVGGVVVVLGAIAMLQRLSRVAAAQRLAAERCVSAASSTPEATTAGTARVAQPLADHDVASATAQTAPIAIPAPAGWTPVAVPKPLYLMRDAAGDDASPAPGGPGGPDGGARPAAFDLEALREAARRSEQAIRDAHARPGVVTFGQVAASSHTPVSSVGAERPASSDAETQPIARAAIAEAVRLAPIQAPDVRLADRPSKWANMGVVDTADADERVSISRRRRAS